MKLSVVLATRNEEDNIAKCLSSVKSIADEIVVVDEFSDDRTKEIAHSFGAKVYEEPHHEIFHITKQKALEYAKGEWILQLDADEEVSPELTRQIENVLNGEPISISPKKERLFKKHQFLVEKNNGPIGMKTGDVVGYFIPRKNLFLGRVLIHAGVYPDGVIRLVKNGFARFPQKSVHEQIQLDGRVAWLSGELLHNDSPTLKKYLKRLNRYTDLQSEELRSKGLRKNCFNCFLFTIYKPLQTFTNLYFRHLGFLDGVQGFLWSFFSATHFPISYFKYLTNKNEQ